jgi:catechol 2,3-dioxygenase-like lactoylglutathione lyase family enzyme
VLGFVHRRDLRVPDAPASTLLRVPAPVGMTAVYLERDGFTLELLHFDREGNAPRRDRPFTEPGLTHLSFTVEDLAASCHAVTALGGEVLADTDVAGLAVMVRDPDGQLIELLPAGPPAR